MRAAAAVLVCLAACVDDGQALLPGTTSDAGSDAGAGAVDADAGQPAGSGSVFDPAEVIRPPEVLTVFAPTDAPRPVLQGSPFRLVWTGESYLLFWVENTGGRLRAMVRKVAPEVGPIMELLPDPPTDPDDVMQFRPVALVEGRRVVLVWHTRRSVQIAWTDVDGRLVEGPNTIRAFTGSNNHYAWFIGPDQGQANYVLFGTDFADRDDALRVTRVGPQGESFGVREVPGLFEPEPFDLTWVGPRAGGWSVTWNSRRPGPNSPTQVWYVELGADFVPISRRIIFERENLRAGLVWPAAEPRYIVAAEYGIGLQLLDLDGTLLRTVPARFWSQVVPETDGPRLGVLAQTGDVDPVGGLPTGLSYLAWDPATDSLSSPTVLQPDDGRCVERAEGVAAGDRIGVAWVMGCDRRTLYFTELRAD